jgi:hypothetical protein
MLDKPFTETDVLEHVAFLGRLYKILARILKEIENLVTGMWCNGLDWVCVVQNRVNGRPLANES